MRTLAGTTFILLLLIALAGCTKKVATAPSGQTVTGDKAEAINLLQESGTDLQQLMNTPDVAAPDWVIARASCMIVIPHMVKGGFVIGAKNGTGVATCRQPNGGWSAPAFVSITGGTWGPQIGVQVADMALAVMNKDGMNALLDSNLKLGAHGAVTAGPVGREAQASEGGYAQAGILAYSRTKGLYAGLTLEGAYVRANDNLNQTYYGRNLRPKAILSGEIPPPQSAQIFLKSLGAASNQAASNE